MAEAHWHPKRESRRFEPPPWERDRFEEIERRRAEAEAAAEAEPVAATQLPATAEPPEPRGEGRKPAGGELPLSQAQIDAMLMQLSAEEPRVDRHRKWVGLFGSVIAMLLGVSMFAWGVYGFMNARGQLAGVVGALIVFGMGLFFAVLGFVLGWRVTNDQGEK